MTRAMVIEAMMLALIGVCPVVDAADGSAGNEAQAIIEGVVGSNVQGIIGVNVAAGDANLQSNGMAISAADVAVAQAQAVQVIDAGQFSVPEVAVARIEGGAFNHAAGAIAINQAAGAVNAQANGVAIAFGGAEVTADAELAQSISGVAPMAASANGHYREATVADTAFTGSRGIVQVNQSAGVANATSNSFTLRVQLGVSQ